MPAAAGKRGHLQRAHGFETGNADQVAQVFLAAPDNFRGETKRPVIPVEGDREFPFPAFRFRFAVAGETVAYFLLNLLSFLIGTKLFFHEGNLLC